MYQGALTMFLSTLRGRNIAESSIKVYPTSVLLCEKNIRKSEKVSDRFIAKKNLNAML
jgi:hypothetical protein